MQEKLEKLFLFIAMSLFYGQNQFRRIAKADAVIHFLLQADCVVKMVLSL